MVMPEVTKQQGFVVHVEAPVSWLSTNSLSVVQIMTFQGRLTKDDPEAMLEAAIEDFNAAYPSQGDAIQTR